MKISIGIRANPNQVTYCILTSDNDHIEIKIIDKIVTPKALDIPEQLKLDDFIVDDDENFLNLE